jgi:hypothetical protein
MTVMDAQNLLYEWYSTNDCFEMNRDIRKVVPIMENEEECLSAFKLGLRGLVERELIAPQEYGDKQYFVLLKSYESYSQTVELNSFTAKWMSGEINEFCELIEDKTDICAASSLSDKDVRNLIHIIQFYKQKTMEKEEIISGMNSDLVGGMTFGEDDENSDDNEEKSGDDKKDDKKKK